MRISRDHTWKSQSLRRIAQLQTRRMRAVSPSLCTSPQEDLQKSSKIYSYLPLLPLMHVFSLNKNPFFAISLLFTPRLQCVLPTPILFLFSPIYITPQDLNFVSKKENSPISFLLLFFF